MDAFRGSPSVALAEAALRLLSRGAKSVTTKVSIGLLNCTLFNYSHQAIYATPTPAEISIGFQICVTTLIFLPHFEFDLKWVVLPEKEESLHGL